MTRLHFFLYNIHVSKKFPKLPTKLIVAIVAVVVFLGAVGSIFALNPLRRQALLSPETEAVPPTLTNTPATNLIQTAPTPLASPSASASPSATPTPKPLTFSEMNDLYGPCVHLPVLMYHHVQDHDIAQANGYIALTVNTSAFRSQMEYLNQKGYTTVSPVDLANFFDSGTPLPKKPVMITFDDGYEDFGSVAAPILNQYNMKATNFIISGLVENHNYLLWSTLNDLRSHPNLYFGNHTWSHHGMTNNAALVDKEIGTADKQLSERGYNPDKIFAYPYGTVSQAAISWLQGHNYRIAFTTQPGQIECKKQRLTLPRTRIGNGSLSAYGL